MLARLAVRWRCGLIVRACSYALNHGSDGHYVGGACTHMVSRSCAYRSAEREAIHWRELRAETFLRACGEVATQRPPNSEIEQAW